MPEYAGSRFWLPCPLRTGEGRPWQSSFQELSISAEAGGSVIATANRAGGRERAAGTWPRYFARHQAITALAARNGSRPGTATMTRSSSRGGRSCGERPAHQGHQSHCAGGRRRNHLLSAFSTPADATSAYRGWPPGASPWPLPQPSARTWPAASATARSEPWSAPALVGSCELLMLLIRTEQDRSRRHSPGTPESQTAPLTERAVPPASATRQRWSRRSGHGTTRAAAGER